MTDKEIKKTLEKQLQLLSECSFKGCLESELACLTSEMVKLAELLRSFS